MAFHNLGAAAAARLAHHDFAANLSTTNPAQTVAHAGKLLRCIGSNRALVRTSARCHQRAHVWSLG
jgi:hypothetical protein